MSKMRTLSVLLISTAAPALTSCSAGEAVSTEFAVVDTLPGGGFHVVNRPEGFWALTGEAPWRLEEDLRIGVMEGEEPYMFGSPRNVIPDATGRIWVLDSRAFELRLFDAEGRFVRAVGREGDGPGEFGFNPCAFAGPEGEIWVEAGGRWQRFDTAGTYLGGQPTTRSLGCGVRQWPPDGEFVAVTTEYDPATDERTSGYIRHDRDTSGAVVPRDTVFPPDTPESPRVEWVNAEGRTVISSYVPLVHRASRLLGPGGDFWITEGGGDYRIRRESLEGDTLLVLERPYEPVPIADSARAAEIAALEREGYRLSDAFDPDDVPHVYPPFDRYMISTDGTLWVQRQLEGGRYGLDVFAPDGRYLGPVVPPADYGNMFILLVTPDRMYGTVRDELDVRYVVRLAIRKPEG